MADANVIRAFKKAVRDTGASPRVAKALFEAGITESGLRNLNYGDRDSLGALQQRPSSGYRHATEPYKAALDFLRQAQQLNRRGFKGSAGELAQAVQRSAFPARYDTHGAEAASYLSGVQTGSPQAGGSTTTTTTTQVDQSARRALLAQYLLDRGNPDALLSLAAGMQNLPTNTTTTTNTTGGSKTYGGGGSFSKSHSPLLELFWQGAGGIDAKNGVKEPQGFVSGHTDHVHVAAGPKTVVELGRIAQQKFGLHVGENPHYGGVHPVHVQNSYHYKGEAIDVSGPPARMRQFAHYVASLYGIK